MLIICCSAYALAVAGGVRGGIVAITSNAPYRGSSMIGPVLVAAAGGVMLILCAVAANLLLRKRRSHWILITISALIIPAPASVGARYLWEINAWGPFPYFLALALLLAALSMTTFLANGRVTSTAR